MTESTLPVHGPFIRLGKYTWVRYDAIVLVRSRSTNNPDGSGSEVIVRSAAVSSPNAYTVWTDDTPESIINAVMSVTDQYTREP